MNRFVELTNQWSSLMVEQAWTIFWQSTLLVIVVALLMLLLRKASPTLRFWLWQLVAVKLLLLPLWKVDAPQPAWLAQELATPPTINSTSLITESTPPPSAKPTRITAPTLAVSPTPPPLIPLSRPAITWHTWLVALWMFGALYQIARLLQQRNQLQKLIDRARPLPELNAEVRHCAALLGLKNMPVVLRVEEEISPFVCSQRSPKLILPQSLTTTVNSQRLRQIILHELAHIRRRDLLWGWISTVMRIAYWFHPAAGWVARQIQLERELACDLIAMHTSGSTAGEYAHTLVDVVSYTASQVAAQAAFTAQFAGEPK